ncbi:MAG: DUF1080 domain-containing protein [Gammaproteobacteria bacterium]|nr:MAG: DUF1080 domain-containing protein [Gammaproteobacteria bacterium]
MKKFPIPLLILLLTGSQPSTSAEQIASAPTTGAGWVSLFDGKSFEGWRGYAQEKMPSGWTIDDGAMCACEPGPGMDIVSHDTYTSFEFEVEWKVNKGSNSGIMWHVDETAGAYPWMTGPEYQVLDDDAFDDGALGVNSAASNYDVQAPTEDASTLAGDWQATRIVVDGNHIEHWLNGVKVLEYQKGSENWQKRVTGSKWANMASYGSTTTGHIAFQGDHGVVWFRNLRIRRLD